MEFSIIIPTYKNFKYLKLTIDSIKKNSKYEHEIIIHVNGNDKETQNYINYNNFKYTYTDKNVGLCSGVNMASKKAKNNYILYSHDDMYFLPDWDDVLINEVKNIKNNNFYLSLTHISHMGPVKGDIQHIQFDCGGSLENFNEEKLLKHYREFKFRDLQGSHWAPHLINKNLWIKVGGFSEEFNPGFASDPDLNMKLWVAGVRIFKGISLSRVYHFGSLTTRKKDKIIRNNGKRTFLLKWKMTVDFFVKHYLRRGEKYDGPLNNPKKNFSYFFDLFLSKSKYFFVKFIT